MLFEYKKKMALMTGIAVFFVIIDRFLKILALNYYNNNEINIIGDFFKFNFAKNYNIAFSLPFSGPILNIVIILIILILIYYLIKLVRNLQNTLAGFLVFIILGAISNIVDRVKYGYVVDYLDLDYFTVFNIADCMIVCGVAMIILYILKTKKLEN